jgi:protein-tyrosine phosphatase
MSWVWDEEGKAYRDEIDFITDYLAVASLGVASDFALLTQHGVRAVVDASNREGNPRFPGILYHVVPIGDPDERLPEFLPALVDFIDEARRSGPVLVHCVAGISRSPALAMCYLHERHRLSLPAALQHVRSRRLQADPHPLFLRVIGEYYRTRTEHSSETVQPAGGQADPD